MLKSGFTMIELLMVILIVSILGSTAMTQFLDFRTDARIAAARQGINAWRIGIKNQTQQGWLRCGKSVSWMPSSDSIIANDVTSGASTCTTTQIPAAVDRKFVDSPPKNPWNGLTNVIVCLQADACDIAIVSEFTAGWCYDVANVAFWPLTTKVAFCSTYRTYNP